MNWKNSASRYGSLSIAIHWLMLLLFVAVYGTVEVHEVFEKGSDLRALVMTWHFMLGLLVFVLVWLRLAARLSGPPRHRAGTAEPATTGVQAAASGAVCADDRHAADGLADAQRRRQTDPVLRLELPALIGESKDLAEQLEELHEVIGTTGYFLIGLHTVAALYHHHFVHDNTLTRMLPSGNRPLFASVSTRGTEPLR